MEAMEGKGGRQWSSLIVPSVQEMVKEKNITTVPSRYIRSETQVDKAEIVHDSGVKHEIPVIDMKLLCSSSSSSFAMDSEIEKLDSACKESGFFQLINHGVDSSLLDKLKTEIQAFFNLPVEEKMKFWQRTDDREGFGQAFVVSEDQKLDWADLFFLVMQPARTRNPNLFPKLPLPLRDTLETYSSELKSITKLLFAKMASALKIKPEEMEDLIGDMVQNMRINYYPPCPQPDLVTGLTPHSDASGLTILLQVNEVEGLQIKRDGKWVDVKPLPNAFIVNVGDILEIVTNGTYRSVEHRAMVNAERERVSEAMFHSPGKETKIGPARSLVERHNIEVFKTVAQEQYFNGFFSRELKGKSYLDVMRL